MLGHAQVKPKSVKYLGGGKFELVLTDVEASDINELLAFSGQFVNFQFGKTIKINDGEFEDEPQNGRLFTTDGSGVVQSVEGVTDNSTAGIYVCDKCGLHVGELDEGGNDTCPECNGKLIYQECADEETAVEIAEDVTEETVEEEVLEVPVEIESDFYEDIQFEEPDEEMPEASNQ